MCNWLENINMLTGIYSIIPHVIGSKVESYFAHNLNFLILDFTLDKKGIKYIFGTKFQSTATMDH